MSTSMNTSTLFRIGPFALLLVAHGAAAQSTTAYPHNIDACNIQGGINCLRCHPLYDDGEQALTRYLNQQEMCEGCHTPAAGVVATFGDPPACTEDTSREIWNVAVHRVTAHLGGLNQSAGSDVVTAPNARFEQMGLQQLWDEAQQSATPLNITLYGDNAGTYEVLNVISETQLQLNSNLASTVANGNFDIPQVIDCGSCHDPHGLRDGTNKRLIRQDVTIYKNVPQVSSSTVPTFSNRLTDFARAGSYDGVCNVCHTQTIHHTNDGVGADHWPEDENGDGAQDCVVCHPHSAGFRAIGDACDRCHLQDAPDVDSWDIHDGTMTVINLGDWSNNGHGKNAVAQGTTPCLNCHDKDVPHKDNANPFRLTTSTMLPAFAGKTGGPIDTCLVCHAPGAPGWNNNTASGTAVTTTHAGTPRHGTTGRSGGTLCWDCHDPHGDSNARMINDQLMANNPDQGSTDPFGLTGSRVPGVFDGGAVWGDDTGTLLCNACHSDDTMHYSSAYFTSSPWWDGTHPTTGCSNCHDHYTYPQAFFAEGTQTCTSCHLTTSPDLDSWDPTDGTKTNINSAEWADVGHGYMFAGANICLYCHVVKNSGDDGGGATPHPSSGSNPFRLAQVTADPNDNCLVCHGVGSLGYDPDDGTAYANVAVQNDANRIERSHAGAKHSASNDGGTFCWDCHDPHGDDVDGSGSGIPGNIKLIGRELTIDSSDGWGMAGTRTQTAVIFTSSAVGSDFAGGGAEKICNACHDQLGTATPANHYTASGSDLHMKDEKCTVCHSHSDKQPTDEAFAPLEVQDCKGCHGTPNTDSDNWNITDGNKSLIDRSEWSTRGHGQHFPTTRYCSVSTGTSCTIDDDCPGGEWCDPAPECLYCHRPWSNDNRAGDHWQATNPFRLANYDALGNGWNDNCIICHGSTGYGYTGYPSIDSSLDVDYWHADTDDKHTADDGGKLCWDCHDPHGDNNNIQMIGDFLMYGSADEYGLTGSRTSTTVFVDNTADTNFVSRGDPITATGVCNVCHTATNHYKQTSGDNHYAGTLCTTCHLHTRGAYTQQQAFQKPPGGGGCLGCHGGAFQGARRPVLADFGDPGPDFVYGTGDDAQAQPNSHHVRTGTLSTPAPPAGTAILTEADCVVCHAEGDNKGDGSDTAVTNPDYHGGDGGPKTIDLRNVDVPNTVFRYNKDAIRTAVVNTPADWFSKNETFRLETQKLDAFCLTCHDDDGAWFAGEVIGYVEVGATNLNPFDDDVITNNYDQLDRGAVVDIASMVVAGGFDLDTKVCLSNGTTPCTGTGDCGGGACEGRGPDGINDPPEGIFSRHAIRGQSLSPYTQYTGVSTGIGSNEYTMYDYNATAGEIGFVSVGNLLPADTEPVWNDTSVMSCADCHTTDGANGATGNAHGSTSEYLLKDANLGATEGTNAANTYVCYACHAQPRYVVGSNHAANGSDMQDSTALTGAARSTPFDKNAGPSVYGIGCMNCHGGVTKPASFAYNHSDPTAWGYGGIHGTSSIWVNGGGGVRPAYRFTNGGSMRFYDPKGWEAPTSTSVSCYTISAGDKWGGCRKHGGNAGSRAKIFSRRLSY